MEQLPATVIMRFEEGVLIPDDLTNKIRLESWMKGLKEGDKISCMYEQVLMDSTHAQNNYLHKLIGVISQDTGQDFSTVKTEVKIKAGLWQSKTELKSAGDYSKSEMSRAIQAAIELGEDLGINLYSM